MKKQNKLIEEIYTGRAITAFSVFCALFVALLFVLKTDELKLYIASTAILAVSSFVAAAGLITWIFGAIRKAPMRTFSQSFIGELIFFGALSGVLFAFLIKDGYGEDVFGVLLAYGILVTALYTVFASARDAFSHALNVGIGIAALYVLRHFQGGSKFFFALSVCIAVFIGFFVFTFLRKKKDKSELIAIGASSVFNAASAALFAVSPSVFFYIIGANVIIYFVTRLFVKL